ncbi:cyclohexyl-isocyanide hydratase [Bradyrhizobium sp. USDA 4449]
MPAPPFTVGMVMFKEITQLDLTGPLEVLSSVPNWRVDLVSSSLAPVASARGFTLQPTATFKDLVRYDLLVVPGGPGVDAAMLNQELIEFVAAQGRSARYIFAICTGSLLLGAAGLLKGKRSSCHWQALHFLTSFGATPSEDRMTIDGNLFSSGGVTAGIDMALQVVAEIEGVEVAERIQLLLEYAPQPPFHAGSPKSAPPKVLERLTADMTPIRSRRAEAVAKASSKLMN